MLLGLHYNPWKEMDRMMKTMNDFIAYPYGLAKKASKDMDFYVNMWSDEDQLVFTAELPGIKADKLSIDLLDDTLTIQGERQAQKDVVYHRRERSEGNFKRIFQLPYKIDAEKIAAKYQKGILYITLPRSEQDKPKKIEVSVT